MTDKTVISKKISPVVIVFLGLLAAIAPLSTDMYLPALPSMTDNFNVSSSMVQLTLTGSLVGMAVGQLFAGPLSDIFGRKPPLIASMLIFSLATAGCFLSDSIYPFLCFRLLQGFFGGAGIVIARAVVRDIASGPELMKLFSMLMLVNGLAPVADPVIGGQILRFFSWRGVFALLFIIAVGLTVGSLIFKETLKTTGKGGLKKSLIMYRILMRDTYFMGHCIMQCFAFAAFFAYIAGSSFLFQNVYHLSAQAYSYLFGINGYRLVAYRASRQSFGGPCGGLENFTVCVDTGVCGKYRIIFRPLFSSFGSVYCRRIVCHRIDPFGYGGIQLFPGYGGTRESCGRSGSSYRLLFSCFGRTYGSSCRHCR